MCVNKKKLPYTLNISIFTDQQSCKYLTNGQIEPDYLFFGYCHLFLTLKSDLDPSNIFSFMSRQVKPGHNLGPGLTRLIFKMKKLNFLT